MALFLLPLLLLLSSLPPFALAGLLNITAATFDDVIAENPTVLVEVCVVRGTPPPRSFSHSPDPAVLRLGAARARASLPRFAAPLSCLKLPGCRP